MRAVARTRPHLEVFHVCTSSVTNVTDTTDRRRRSDSGREFPASPEINFIYFRPEIRGADLDINLEIFHFYMQILRLTKFTLLKFSKLLKILFLKIFKFILIF